MRTSVRRALIASASILALTTSTFVTTGFTAANAKTNSVAVLKKDLNRILDEPGLANAQASVEVRDSEGAVLYTRENTERLTPASNNKLYTAAAALEVLGPDHRFKTDLLAKGRQVRSVFRGDLYLRGSGDPSLLASDLDSFAKKLEAKGITKISGSVIGDDSAFDRKQLGDSWTWDDESAYYAAPISALTVSPDDGHNTATVVVEVAPGPSAGDPAAVGLRLPTSAVRLDNQATTSNAGGPTAISVRRDHATNVIRVSGTISVGAVPKRSIQSVPDATAYATTLFREALAKRGVSVTRPDEIGTTPTGATPIASHESQGVSKLIVPFMKYSNNGYGELLTKAMGVESSGTGTWSSGLTAAEKALKELGVDTSELRRADGSGLSRKNLTSAQQLTNLLVGAQARPWFKAYYDSQPIAGHSDPPLGGSLSGRMRGTPAENNVHAKTGSLTGVSSLSGYVTDRDGERLIFSIVHNNWVGKVNPKQIEDRIAIRLAQFTRSEAGSEPILPVLPKTRYGPNSVECTWVGAC